MTRRPGNPNPPRHLRAATKRWWSSVVASFEFEEHHLRLLQLAAEAWDRGAQARKVLTRCGLTYEDRFHAPRARPEVAVERDSRVAFARLIRELKLDIVDPNDSRIPGLNGGRTRA
jgi:phage terminase small subunit